MRNFKAVKVVYEDNARIIISRSENFNEFVSSGKLSCKTLEYTTFKPY